jgi:uncharacterized membrane protein YtjA (UPF0391 family)
MGAPGLCTGRRPRSKRQLYRYVMQILLTQTNLVRAMMFPFNHIGSGNEAAIYHRENDLAATRSGPMEGRNNMLYYALVFLLVAIVAAVLGFGGVAVISASIAKILFFVFIVLFLVSLITHMSRRV